MDCIEDEPDLVACPFSWLVHTLQRVAMFAAEAERASKQSEHPPPVPPATGQSPTRCSTPIGPSPPGCAS